jgi:hypothetical protein
MRPRALALAGVAVAAASFALGLAAAGWLRRAGPAPAPQPSTAAPPPFAPRVLVGLDAGSIQLLPDASLRLDLPLGPDAGAHE